MLPNKDLPQFLRMALKRDILKGIVLFGSRQVKRTGGDIDLAVFVADKHFDNLLGLIKKYPPQDGFDVSIMKESEVCENKKFFFGGHGVYLAQSIKSGKVIYGTNLLSNYHAPSEEEIKQDIYYRLREYVFSLRKSYFNSVMDRIFLDRYNKFIKLSTYLLTKTNHSYPEIMRISNKLAISQLCEAGYQLSSNKKKNAEMLWAEINNKYWK